MKDIRWNRIVFDEYCYLCPPTKDEWPVLLDWFAEETVAHTVMHHNMSEAKVYKIKDQIRQKYDDVQPYSAILPPRT